MGGERESSRSRDNAEKTKSEDRTSRSPRRAEASAKAALEKDHEQSYSTDLLQRDDRQLAGRGDAEQARSDADSEERSRTRQPNPREERNSSKRRQEESDGESQLGKEVGVIGHA